MTIKIEEVKEQIETVRNTDAGWGYTNPEDNIPTSKYPSIFFVGRVGEKTHLGKVGLTMSKSGTLELNYPRLNCGSQRYNTRNANASTVSGKHTVTCKKCKPGEVDLDELNAEYMEIIPLIGTKI